MPPSVIFKKRQIVFYGALTDFLLKNAWSENYFKFHCQSQITLSYRKRRTTQTHRQVSEILSSIPGRKLHADSSAERNYAHPRRWKTSGNSFNNLSDNL